MIVKNKFFNWAGEMKLKLIIIFLNILLFQHSVLLCSERGDTKASVEAKVEESEIKGLDEGDVKEISGAPGIKALEGDIWIETRDKTKFKVPKKIAILSKILRDTVVMEENSENEPFPLFTIDPKEFQFFLDIMEYLLWGDANGIPKNEQLKKILKYLEKRSAKVEDIGRLYFVAYYLDIPKLLDFIFNNIVKLCSLDASFLDRLLKDINGSLFNVINEPYFKKELLKNKEWLLSILSEAFIKSKLRVAEVFNEKNLEIMNFRFPKSPIQLPNNIVIIRGKDGLIKIEQKGIFSNRLIKVFDAQTLSVELSGDKKKLAVLKNNVINFYDLKIEQPGDVILLESLDYIKAPEGSLSMVFNYDGSQILILNKNSEPDVTLMFCENINNKWRFSEALKIGDIGWNTNIYPISLDNYIFYGLLHNYNPSKWHEPFYDLTIVFPDPELNKKLSVNQLILLMVLNEFNQSIAGQEIMSRYHQVLLDALKNYSLSIQYQIAEELGFSNIGNVDFNELLKYQRSRK